MDKWTRLKEQVKMELAWAKEALAKEKSDPGRERYDRGMLFAYESILSTINNLDREDEIVS
jgi:hypothetical protein